MPRTASQSSQHRYTNQEMKRSRSSSNAKERANRVLESDVPLRIQRLQPVQILRVLYRLVLVCDSWDNY